MILAGLGSVADAISAFFERLAAVEWGPLGIGLAFFLLGMTLRSRAYFHALRAAYPGVRFPWRRVWGAYMASFGTNGVVPAHPGGIVKLFLLKASVPGSTYPTLASSLAVEAIFDWSIAVPIMIFAFTQGVFPKPPDFSALHAFGLSFFASHFRLTLFLLTVLAVLGVIAFAVLAARVRAFWARLRQGVAIVFDRRRYLREVWAVQAAGWLCKATSFWFLLEAFGIPGTVGHVMLVMAVNVVASLVPFAPGGAGVQQALLVKVLAGTASGATVAAYSVGQQVAIAASSFAVGFLALVLIFRFRSFRAVIAAGRASRRAEAAPG